MKYGTDYLCLVAVLSCYTISVVSAVGDHASDSLSLYRAACRGDVTAVHSLLQAGADVDVAEPFFADTPLKAAAAGGYTNVVAMLLHAGANTELPYTDGRTALHFAAHEGHAETTAQLMAAGADHLAKDQCLRTPLDCALERRHRHIACMLVHRGEQLKRRPQVQLLEDFRENKLKKRLVEIAAKRQRVVLDCCQEYGVPRDVSQLLYSLTRVELSQTSRPICLSLDEQLLENLSLNPPLLVRS